MLKPRPNWIVPPACQGQAVTISYAACPSGDGVLKEVAVPGELPRRYRASWDDVISDFDLCYLDGIADYLEHLDGRRDDSIPDDLTGPALIAWLAGWREAEEAA